MELKLLRSFVVLCEELHFGRAAERLCIVQPALSMQIKALEQELGVQLFHRTRHQVELSAAGQLFLQGAQSTLDQAERAVQQVRAGDQGEIGCVRIGFVSSVLPHYLPGLIRRLHERFPLIELELKDMSTTDQLRLLHERKLDFGFSRLPVEAAGVRCEELFSEPFVLALPVDHKLARLAEIAPRDLAAQPCFVLARRFAPGFYDKLLLALAGNGLTLRIERELGEFTTMLALVGAGMGIGIVPALAMAAQPPGVVAKPLALPNHASCIGLTWVEPVSAVNRTFLGVATGLAAEAP